MNIEGSRHGAKQTWLESVIYLEIVALVLRVKFYFCFLGLLKTLLVVTKVAKLCCLAKVKSGNEYLQGELNGRTISNQSKGCVCVCVGGGRGEEGSRCVILSPHLR